MCSCSWVWRGAAVEVVDVNGNNSVLGRAEVFMTEDDVMSSASRGRGVLATVSAVCQRI